MKSLVTLLCLFLYPLLAVAENESQVGVREEWEPILQEEFDGEELNSKIWTASSHESDPINNEAQAYRPENVIVRDGVCILRAEKKTSRQYKNTMDYSSGEIQTFKKFSFKYGYIEARIKLPGGLGTWPGFWMMPDRGKTSYSKIDEWARSYIKFDVSSLVPRYIKKVNLILQRSSSSGWGHFWLEKAKDNWTENGITWENRPDPIGTMVADGLVQWHGNQYSFDVTNVITEESSSDGIATFSLFSNYNFDAFVNFKSRETNQGPVLVVEKKGGSVVNIQASADAHALGGSNSRSNFGQETYITVRDSIRNGASSTFNGGNEIDILENLGKWGTEHTSSGMIWDGYGSKKRSIASRVHTWKPSESGFHRYGLLWEPGKYTFSIDGQILSIIESEFVSSVPEYLILNLALGGNWGGPVDDNVLPANMEIDYVRVWQGEGNSFEGSPKLTIRADADGYGHFDWPKIKTGRKTVLWSQHAKNVDAHTAIPYVHFTLDQLPRLIDKVFLRIKTKEYRGGSQSSVVVAETHGKWNEATISAHVAPSVGSAIMSYGPVRKNEQSFRVDITNYIKDLVKAGENEVSVALLLPHFEDRNYKHITFYSRETDFGPRLEIYDKSALTLKRPGSVMLRKIDRSAVQ